MLYECWFAIELWSKVVLCAHFECNVALYVDTTTSADGTNKISQESAKDVPEDQVNVTKGYRKPRTKVGYNLKVG
jgi:hypothetical protein